MLLNNSIKSNNNPLRQRARSALIMLTAQFVLGMAVNLIGLPSEADTPFAKISSTIFLDLHMLIALGLLIGAVLAIKNSITQKSKFKNLVWIGAASVVISTIGGMLTMGTTGKEWWSYLMAIGFISAFISYGMLYMRTQATK